MLGRAPGLFSFKVYQRGSECSCASESAPYETVWEIRMGHDLGCSEWPKQDEEVPSRPLEPLNTGDQDPSGYFPDRFIGTLVHKSMTREEVGAAKDSPGPGCLERRL